MFVFLKVSIQIGLLAKTSITQVAFERFLFVVYVPYMPLQIGGDAKRPVTIFTSEDIKKKMDLEKMSKK